MVVIQPLSTRLIKPKNIFVSLSYQHSSMVSLETRNPFNINCCLRCIFERINYVIIFLVHIVFCNNGASGTFQIGNAVAHAVV